MLAICKELSGRSLQVASSPWAAAANRIKDPSIFGAFSYRRSTTWRTKRGTFHALFTDRSRCSSDTSMKGGMAMSQSQVHILVVDDERNIRNNLGMVLEAEGYKVDTSSKGDEALNRVKEGRYDIAFVDFQMPKMDGLELLRFLRELRPKMPVVMLTAYGTTRRAVEAMKLGAIDFLEKPFDPKSIKLLCQE